MGYHLIDQTNQRKEVPKGQKLIIRNLQQAFEMIKEMDLSDKLLDFIKNVI